MAYATIRDVARRAGVSVSTVSRALNDSGRISHETRDRVRQVIEELHYVPDSRARSMHSLHSQAVGLLIPDIRNSYFADLAYSVQHELLRHDLQTLICTADDRHDQERTLVGNLLGQHIDGAIVVPSPSPSPAVDRLLRQGIPVVYIDRTPSAGPDEQTGRVPVVDADPRSGLRSAIADLHAQGHRRVTLITGSLEDSDTLRERRRVFERELSRFPDMSDPQTQDPGIRLGWEPGSTARNARLAAVLKERGTTAVVFSRSQDAIEALGIFQGAGWVIGRDLSLVSFDDLPIFSLLTPSISVISQQVDRMGAVSVATLLRLMKGEEARSLRLETRYIRRQSVGPSPGSAAGVTAPPGTPALPNGRRVCKGQPGGTGNDP